MNKYSTAKEMLQVANDYHEWKNVLDDIMKQIEKAAFEGNYEIQVVYALSDNAAIRAIAEVKKLGFSVSETNSYHCSGYTIKWSNPNE